APTTRVQLPSFWMDRREVSNAEYEQCVASGNCAVRRLWECTRPTDGGRQPVDDPAPYLDPDQPAVCVSQGEAAGYCFLRGARLPSRSEWEKAARGTDGRRHPWGNDPPSCERGNFSSCGHTAGERVGSYPDHPSPFGALDLAGNVAEWVMPDVGPDGMYEQGHDAEVRGGHFASAPVQLRAAARMFLPSTQERRVEVGFRCAADPDRAHSR
ncbi:MAG TPA: SUMF1/EgtB/PvdO family nonheme iron enzyme, partial [Enhygromyxa sp.]|nr:SUMF1/EgtB/PvdO family nonheme iron enzyme [Enhygromyxa sp.]